jgi:hypothetical protein
MGARAAGGEATGHDHHRPRSSPHPYYRARSRHQRRQARDPVVPLLAIGVIALHVIDDHCLQPEPGTAAGDHLVSGLVPLAVLGLGPWGGSVLD